MFVHVFEGGFFDGQREALLFSGAEVKELGGTLMLNADDYVLVSLLLLLLLLLKRKGRKLGCETFSRFVVNAMRRDTDVTSKFVSSLPLSISLSVCLDQLAPSLLSFLLFFFPGNIFRFFFLLSPAIISTGYRPNQ